MSTARALLPIIALVIACGGCTSMRTQPTNTALKDIPPAWSGSERAPAVPAEAPASWWQRFNDPLLNNLIDKALQDNTSIAVAKASLQQARASSDVSAAALLPSVSGSGSVQRAKSNIGTANSFNAGLDASWELDIFGANRRAVDAADAAAQASAAGLGDVQVSIAAEVALDYISLRSAQARLAIAADNLASEEETLQITQWRQQAGLVTALEVDQATTAVEQTRAELPVLRISIEQSRHALAILTGQPPMALANDLATVAPVPQPAGEPAMRIPAETLRQRADVRAAEYQVSAAWARVAQADAARWPDFRLGGSLGLSALTLGTLTNGASVVNSILAGVSMPIFDGGALRAQVRVQEAAMNQASATYRATVLTALQEVEDALVALRNDRDRLARLQLAAQAAGQAAAIARQRFESGLIDFQVVLDTERTRLTTQENAAISNGDVSADYVRLYKALGGGWDAQSLDAASDLTHATPESRSQ
jgi:NodT family efflux transporter outer membrane factor (OMF) lipoprotein